MSAPSSPLAAKVDELVAAFNRGSLDVPGGLLARDCVFRLNGTAFEDTLGRPVSDPLTRLLGRGSAAYRFAAQAVRYAVPDAALRVEGLQGRERAGLVTGIATLTGTPRGTDRPLVAIGDLAVLTDGQGLASEVGLRVGGEVLRILAAAREA
jgi:hypothetical protein